MTEKEIIQKIYEVIKLVDCMQYNPLVDFNYLRAKGAYNIVKNQVAHIEAENAELRKRLYDVEGRMERHMLALKSVCEKYVVAANINTITDENGKSWIADKEICAIALMANELKKIDDNIGRYKK